MTHTVASISAGSLIEEARRVFAKHHYHHLPVLEGARVIGVLSLYDLSHDALPSVGSMKTARCVREIMSPALVTAHRETTARDAARMMIDHRIGALPVVDLQGALLGIVTKTDLVRAIAADQTLLASS